MDAERTSGWYCTPQIGFVLCLNAWIVGSASAAAEEADQAVISSSSGRAVRVSS